MISNIECKALRLSICLIVMLISVLSVPYANAGDHAKALKFIEDGNAQFDKGVVEANAKTGEQVQYFREAISQYESAIAEAPDLVESHFNKGLAIIWLNRCAGYNNDDKANESAACFKKALEVAPDCAEALYCTAQAYFEIVCHAFAKQSHPTVYENAKDKALSTIADLQQRFPASQAATLANKLKADIEYHDKTDVVTAVRQGRQFQPIYPRWGSK